MVQLAAAACADYDAVPASKSTVPMPRRSASTGRLRYAKALGQTVQRYCNRSSVFRLHETHQWPPLALVSPGDASLSASITWPEHASDESALRVPARRASTPDTACQHDAASHDAAMACTLGSTVDPDRTEHTVAPGRGNVRTERGDIPALTEKRAGYLHR